ncbi:MAG: hypothetical protein K2X39_07935 [Silvanigrellaceae bacterium]|nr:hypothetical protein [Silvanigrellaceae bacterium]
MVFWQSNRYQEHERKSTGDQLRGLPGQIFPWMLHHFFFKDYDQHKWEMRILCENISTPLSQNKLIASVHYLAELTFNKESLKELGINADRLFDLELTGWNKISTTQVKNIECDIDSLKEKSMELCDSFVIQIASKFTLGLKKETIFEKIKKSQISKFSF